MRKQWVVLVSLVFVVACTRTPTSIARDAATSPSPSPTATRHETQPTATPTHTIVEDPVNAPWTRALGDIVDVPGVSVAAGIGDRIVFMRNGDTPSVLASNEKLLTSMASLDTLGPGATLRTAAGIEPGSRHGDVVRGDLFLVGGGDPTLDAGDLTALAAKLAAAGIRRVDGDVVGDTTAFDRGWWAPGWIRGISRSYVARPVALRLDTSATSLEATAAASFRDALVGADIEVGGRATRGRAPGDLRRLAAILSPPLRDLLAHQNHESDNLYAELLTKALGDDAYDDGSTAGGARAIRRWAATRGVRADVRDGSGLSDLDRTSPAGVVSLLLQARRAPWFGAFYRSLAAGGEGTLDSRLVGVPVRAKTGTLFVRPTSTLSGYVRSADGRTVAFSVLTRGLTAAAAEPIEDAVVRALAAARVAGTH